MKKFFIMTLIAASLSVGCSGTKTPSQKEQAVKQWNAARGRVMAGLAREQYESGNFEKSRTTVEEAMRMDPKNAELHLLSAKLAIESAQLELAERELKTARTLDPKNAEADYLSGVVAQRWQQKQQALQFYTTAATKAPNELAYALAQAEMLAATERLPEAISLLNDKLDEFDHSPVIRDALGQFYMRESKWNEAAAAFREALILATDDNSIREHLGFALYYAGQYREAIDVLTRALKDPDYSKRADMIAALGQCQMQVGQPRDAKANFELVVQLNASAVESWQNLAKVSLVVGDLPRADLSLRKAMSLEQGNAETHLLLGYLRLKQNRLTDALSAFQKAHELKPDDGVSLCMVGYALEKMGKGDQAVACYAQALRLKPNDELATKLMARVDPRE